LLARITEATEAAFALFPTGFAAFFVQRTFGEATLKKVETASPEASEVAAYGNHLSYDQEGAVLVLGL